MDGCSSPKIARAPSPWARACPRSGTEAAVRVDVRKDINLNTKGKHPMHRSNPKKNRSDAAPPPDTVKTAIFILLSPIDDNRRAIGEQYNIMSDNNLFESRGYPSAMAFVKKEIQAIPPATMFLYSAVARAF